MKKITYIVLLVFLFLSCDRREGLELTLLNENFTAYLENINNQPKHKILTDSNYYKKSLNKIRLKITNHDDVTYIFIPLCLDSYINNCSYKFSFPEQNMMADLRNFEFTDSKGNKAEISRAMYDNTDENLYVFEKYQDSLIENFYNKTGYTNNSLSWKKRNSEIAKKTIIIHPKETLFYETYISFPINYNAPNSILQQISLNINESYKVKFQLGTDIENLENLFTQSQLKTIEINNYILFDKDLISINSIPLKFVD